MYRVKDVMTDEVLTCGIRDSLEVAVGIMRDRDCGFVPVVDDGERVVGLVTDRDAVMCALISRKALADLSVGEACSRSVISCHAEDTLERAELLMRVNRVRRLPVLGADRRLSGVISLTDLARHVELSAPGDRSALSPRHIAAVLAETSGARRLAASGEPRRTQETGPRPIVEAFFHG